MYKRLSSSADKLQVYAGVVSSLCFSGNGDENLYRKLYRKYSMDKITQQEDLHWYFALIYLYLSIKKNFYYWKK